MKLKAGQGGQCCKHEVGVVEAALLGHSVGAMRPKLVDSVYSVYLNENVCLFLLCGEIGSKVFCQAMKKQDKRRMHVFKSCRLCARTKTCEFVGPSQLATGNHKKRRKEVNRGRKAHMR